LNFKGVLLGAVVFFVLTLVYLYLTIRGTGSQATGLNIITALTIQSPIWWMAFIVVCSFTSMVLRSRAH
jgi:TRAP-type C4-dicarboxylate transport system permease small subunit